ncbi:MAG TPA: integrin alpha [Candidatus Limnocylindrales bacterium]|nr:integrin alpha [Candidatus Limnocylindrales bacterium]
MTARGAARAARHRAGRIGSALAAATAATLLLPTGAETPVAEAAARAAFFLSGGVPGESFGCSVAGAGDVNGDGYGDVIVGAYQSGPVGQPVGRAYIYFGGLRPQNRPDVILSGEAVGDAFGVCVAPAGDMNKDGYADVIVGAYQNDARGANAGRAYVFFGGPRPHERPDLILNGEAAGDAFGYVVSSAGDVNQDGYADVIVGAYENSARGAGAGRAYVYFGGPRPDAIPDMILSGEAAGDRFGISVAAAGDVNRDGYGDVMVGAYQNDAGGKDAGRAYVFFGGARPDDRPDLALTGASAGDAFGFAVSGAGDMNKDGYADVIVGAYHNGAGGKDAGRAYVYYGGAAPSERPALVLTGEAAGDAFGYSVSGAGDVNGDGFGDVAVGAYGNDAGGSAAGRAYLFFGGGADVVPDFIQTGEATLDNLGFAVSGAGDVDGDGTADLVVGAPYSDGEAGRAYLSRAIAKARRIVQR